MAGPAIQASPMARGQMEVTVLGSGSAGNALLIRTEICAVLVDVGLSARRIVAELAARGLTMSHIAGILLTHEHGDHTRGLKVLAGNSGVKVYANPLTAEALKRTSISAQWNLFASGSVFDVAGLAVTAFSVPHDAADPVGFVVRHGEIRFGILTDIGYATRHVIDALRGVNALLIETNHDEALLQQDTKRPWSVKQRILSRHGHLSNAAAAAIVMQIAAPELKHLLLGHLSQDCNSAELACNAMSAVLKSAGYEHVAIHCLSPVATPSAFTVVVSVCD